MGALTCPDPGEMYLWVMSLMSISLGMCLIAVAEALNHQQIGWVCWFSAMAVGCLGLYFRAVGWWLDWMRRGN